VFSLGSVPVMTSYNSRGIGNGVFLRVLFFRLRAPPLTRGRGLSFVIVIVRPLSVNIYRFTSNVHVSYKYTYI
jgi:hypothetical protein